MEELEGTNGLLVSDKVNVDEKIRKYYKIF